MSDFDAQSDVEQLDEIAAQTSVSYDHRDPNRSGHINFRNWGQRPAHLKQPFAAAKRCKRRPVTLAEHA